MTGQVEEDQKYFQLLSKSLEETLADVEACKSSLEVKDRIYEKFNYLQDLNLRDLKYDEKKLMQHQIISHEIKVLDEKSRLITAVDRVKTELYSNMERQLGLIREKIRKLIQTNLNNAIYNCLV